MGVIQWGKILAPKLHFCSKHSELKSKSTRVDKESTEKIRLFLKDLVEFCDDSKDMRMLMLIANTLGIDLGGE
jgi:hypothetical protein